MSMPITIERLLRALTQDDRSESAMKFRRKLTHDLPPSQCLVLHVIAEGQDVRPVEHPSASRMLIRRGMVYLVATAVKAANGKSANVLRLTDKGEAMAADVRAIAQAVIDRIHAREGVTV